MRFVFGCMLVVAVAGVAPGSEPLDDLFGQWSTAQKEAKSLVVEFDLETKDSIFDQCEEATGRFCWIRSKKGEVFASYEVVVNKARGAKPVRLSGLLSHGNVYVLDHDSKTALRFEVAAGELRPFLEKHVNPLVVLLDRQRAEKQCELTVVKQDESYVYLGVKPRQRTRHGWFSDAFDQGRVVVMRNGSEAVPKGMPRQLWHTDGTREQRFEIKAWRWNPADGPSMDEFARPEDRPGWEVLDSPFPRKH